MTNTKLIIALDMPTKAQNLTLCENLAQKLAPSDLSNLYLKIGLRSFIRDGAEFVKDLQSLKFKIFLDLKLYDIPNTMLDSLREIATLGVDIVTIHASSGRIAMREMADFAKSRKGAPLIFAVTALTSFDRATYSEIYHSDIENSVANLAQIAKDCGIDGIVCSPFESRFVKERFNLLTLTPAIRPVESDFAESSIFCHSKSSFCHSERSEESQKNNRDSSVATLPQNDNMKKTQNDKAKNTDNDNAKKFQNDNIIKKDDQKRAASLSFALSQKSDFLVIGRPIYTHKEPVAFTKQILQKIKGS